jgi:hypothetical protein
MAKTGKRFPVFVISRVVLACAGIGLIAGCGVVRSNRIAAMAPEQLATVSDQEICRGLMFNKGSANLQAEVGARKLGDCSPDHFQCVPGTGQTPQSW